MRKSSAKLYNWAIEKAASTKAPLWLALLFSLEIVLFIPLDAVLMFFCLQKRQNIFLYIMTATAASMVSALIGYFIGYFLWDLIGHWTLNHLIAPSTFSAISSYVAQYENWAVFFGSLFPFPIKVISVTVGVFDLGIFSFITFFVAARLLRFAIVGGAMALWGEQLKRFVDRHFHRIFVVLGAKIAAAALAFWAFAGG
jgi:membrane protein YqaA with SNARE-associated domain